MSDNSLARHGLRNLAKVNFNLGATALYQEAVRRASNE